MLQIILLTGQGVAGVLVGNVFLTIVVGLFVAVSMWTIAVRKQGSYGKSRTILFRCTLLCGLASQAVVGWQLERLHAYQSAHPFSACLVSWIGQNLFGNIDCPMYVGPSIASELSGMNVWLVLESTCLLILLIVRFSGRSPSVGGSREKA